MLTPEQVRSFREHVGDWVHGSCPECEHVEAVLDAAEAMAWIERVKPTVIREVVGWRVSLELSGLERVEASGPTLTEAALKAAREEETR